MNQILVTEKLYVTPELKRKRKIYKICFMLSVFVIVILCSCYIYAEYDRNKNDELSQEMLSVLVLPEGFEEDNEEDDNVWEIIVASKNKLENEETTSQNQSSNDSSESEKGFTQPTTQKYTASNGNTYDMIGRITIPKINVDEVILSETTVALLKVSPCRFYGPKTPNVVGNLCIAGHNYRNKRFFSKVPTLVVGDIIKITDLTGKTIEYSVDNKYTVDPEDTDCLNQNTNGKRVVTLITCTDDSKQRVIVHATEVT